MTGTGFTSGGFTIPEFGKRNNLTAIRSRDVNEWIIAALNILGRMTVVRGNVNAFVYSEGNLHLVLKNIAEGSAATATASVRGQIDGVFNDYVTVQLWNGSAFAGASISVARPVELRASLASDTIYGTGVSYSASDANTRTASAGGFDTENHKVLPPYEVGREILVIDTGLATGVTDAGANPVTYIDLNIGARTWASVPAIPIP